MRRSSIWNAAVFQGLGAHFRRGAACTLRSIATAWHHAHQELSVRLQVDLKKKMGFFFGWGVSTIFKGFFDEG